VREVAQIKAAYDWMMRAYQAEASKTGTSATAIARLEKYRDALEAGVFVTQFAQFESEVNNHFERACNARRDSPDWNRRRGWDIPAYQSDRAYRVTFDTKLALVLDRRSSFYKNVMRAYVLRNQCAHGKIVPVGSIDQFVNDLFTWQGQLRT